MPYIIAKVLNNSVSPKTSYKPIVMVYGTEGAGNSFLDTKDTVQPHYFVKSQTSHIEVISNEIQEMTKIATDKLTQLRLVTNEKLNQTQSEKNFKTGDIVFTLDRSTVPGSSRVLRTRFSNSPYVVVKPLWDTTLIKRLADGFITLYSNNDLKRYDKTSPLFSTLPPEITKVLFNEFSDFISTDFTEITKYDPFDIPDGVELFNAEDINKAPDRQLPPMNDEEEDDKYTEALKSLVNENLEKDVENLDNVPIRNDLLTNDNVLDTGEITEMKMKI